MSVMRENFNNSIADSFLGETFNCPVCDTVYIHEDALAFHRKHECKQKPQYKCTFCDYKGVLSLHMILHLRSKHKMKRLRWSKIRETGVVQYL